MDFRSTKKGKPYPIKNFSDKFSKDEKDLEKKEHDDKLKKIEAHQKAHKKATEITEKIMPIIMKEHRKNALDSPKGGRPQYMREDPTTPLIHEVPFGPDTRSLQIPDTDEYSQRVVDHNTGDNRHYDIPSHNMSDFNKFEAEQNKLPKGKAFPIHYSNGTGFRVIPHGDISIPKEQERKVLPREKRNYDHGYLKSRSERTHQRDEDAKAIALDIMFDEGKSKFVNQETKKIRPNKPVRSDYASIITAEHGFDGIIKKPTVFVVGEKNKPERVTVTPLDNHVLLRKKELKKRLNALDNHKGTRC
jgi:hypothetical protein